MNRRADSTFVALCICAVAGAACSSSGSANDATTASGQGGDGGSGSGTSRGGSSGGGTASSDSDGGSASCVFGGGGPTGGPGDLFTCDSTWRKDVSSLPVADESRAIMASLPAWGGSGVFQIDFSFVFMHADASTPRFTVPTQYSDESDHDPVPIPVGGSLEGEDGYNCTSGGDCHLLVVDDSQKKLFELYAADHSSGSWTAAGEAVWDLTHSYDARERGLACTSADAAGLPIMPGLIGVRETKAGAIEHALRFILPNSSMRKGPSFVAPASHGTSATSSDAGPPYGTRLRLRASFDESTVTSAGGKAIVHALKTYGMILADGGNIPLVAEDDKFEKAADPTMTWDGLLDSHDVGMIEPSDFDVVDFGAITSGGSCTLLTGL